jgi:DNA-binding transcriptional ArsR family regulator
MIKKVQIDSNDISLLWDIGTAYEFFVSLYVLHEPERFGVRASWAAGIRSRIPPVERKFLEEVIPFLSFPMSWVYGLSQPKDAISAMWAMRQIPPAERVGTLFDIEHWEIPEMKDALLKVAQRRSWGKDDLQLVTRIFKEKHENFEKWEKGVEKYLDWWTRPEEFGEALLAGLQAYYQAFFEEEERRVGPVLQAGLEHAQELAGRLSVADLLVELSQGVRFDELTRKEVILVPAYWTTPMITYDDINETQMICLFGARPVSMSAIPGELVPDGMLRTLKALADPTRLKILHYLSSEELTPSELARRLNLRAPTVTHHLRELRLSGLVNVKIKGQEKIYGARREALEATFGSLQGFLENTPETVK